MKILPLDSALFTSIKDRKRLNEGNYTPKKLMKINPSSHTNILQNLPYNEKFLPDFSSEQESFAWQIVSFCLIIISLC